MNISSPSATTISAFPESIDQSVSPLPVDEGTAATFASLLAAVLPAAPPPLPRAASGSSENGGDPPPAAVGAVGRAAAQDSAISPREAGDGVTDPSSGAIAGVLTTLGAAAAGLDPTLLTKLARVVTRMREEFGRDVTIVEGVRSQARQDRLFAQGRTAPGDIVTWTRNSLHTAGRAADVAIDGGYDDAAGFALLRRVAEEEGLRTLGARDPGHVELRGDGGGASRFEGRTPRGDVVRPSGARTTAGAAPAPEVATPRGSLVAAIAPLARVAALARIAPPAPLAALASVATVATAAPVATTAATLLRGALRLGRGSTVDGSGQPDADARITGDAATAALPAAEGEQGCPVRPVAPPSAAVAPRATSNTHPEGADAPRRESTDGDSAHDGSSSRGAADGRRVAPVIDPALPAMRRAADSDVAPSSGSAGATMARRVDHAVGLQESAAPRSLSRLTLSLDDGAGGEDRIRIGLRGTSVGAAFDVRDAASAERLSSRLSELTRALERRGLEPETFQIRTHSSGARTDAAARDAVATVGGLRDTIAPEGVRPDASADRGDRGEHRFGQEQQDAQQRARARQDEQRRRSATFTLANEE